MAETLKGAIVDRFGSVAACERDTGISRTQLNRALQGKGISLDTARRLAEALEVSVDDLLRLLDAARAA
jgi:DNA-binding Xre family transcriptional regulator